ncbi:MAG: hypothetical protein ACLQMO_05625 [Acidobacteriaceae bacterium]
MPRSSVRTCLSLFCCVLMVFISAEPAHSQCDVVSAKNNTCSYTGLNRDCEITIDRARPATPPTIYARRGSTITILVINPSPFEALSLDFKSAQVIVPPDTFQAFMSAQSNLQKVGVTTVAGYEGPKGAFPTAQQELADQLEKISGRQKLLFAKFDISKLMPQLAKIMQPPPATACKEAKEYAEAVKANKPHPSNPDPWYNTAIWQQEMISQLALDNTGQALDLSGVKKQVETLDNDIEAATEELSQLALADQATVKDKLATVVQNQANLKAAIAARVDLTAALQAIVKPAEGSFKVTDFNTQNRKDGKDHNSLQISWTLDYVNETGVVVKRVVTTPYKPASPSDAVLSPPTKNPLVGVTVQYQSPTLLEFATGIMVPLMPFHSYSTAAVATNGVVTGNVVQETLTYTVVPLALVNIVVNQRNLRKQPVAFFATIGTGYNPTTSSVEFGVGPSFSWRSIMISGLADIDRDTQLAGGFTVGEALPISNPPKPLTTTGWFVKPAIALSVRIPLGGASK